VNVLRGGTVVTEAGVFGADVALAGGRIAAIGRDLDGETLYDATGLHVFAGFVDPHVHGCDEGLSEWEDFATLTAAALAGGVTTLLDMPLNEPPTTTAARLRARGEAIAARSRIAIGLFGGAVPGNVAELDPMARAGAVAFKAFMVETPGWERCDDGTLLDAMGEAARLGLPFAVHAEDQELVAHGEARERAAGRHDVAAHAAAHDEHAETAAIQRALLLARWAGCRLHVVHVGSREGLALLRAASVGVGEGAISLLTLDAADRDRIGPRARIAPPIRGRATVEALWLALADGTLRWIGSDHSPYPPPLKAGEDVWEAPDGAPSIETCFPLALSEGRKRGIPLDRLATLCGAGAARAYGLYPRKGALQPGADADLALVDLDRRWTIQAEALHSKHRWSLSEGAEVTARVVATIRAGELAYADGEVLAPPGSGEWLRSARSESSSDPSPVSAHSTSAPL
jgi:allantoinase